MICNSFLSSSYRSLGDIGGGGTANHIAEFTALKRVAGPIICESGGNVGIAAASPGA